MFGNIGFGELMIIMMIVLLLFGAKRVPEVAKALGKSIFEFKRELNSTELEIRNALKDSERPGTATVAPKTVNKLSTDSLPPTEKTIE